MIWFKVDKGKLNEMIDLSPGSPWNAEGGGLTGGELILAVVRLYQMTYGEKPDLARLNLLLFLAEGDAEIQSDLLFADTTAGPKSSYIRDFVKGNPAFIRMRVYGRAPKRKVSDPDVRHRLELTDEGRRVAEAAMSSLNDSELKKLSRVLLRWGREKHGDLLTYVCIFYGDFCRAVERHEDPNSLSGQKD